MSVRRIGWMMPLMAAVVLLAGCGTPKPARAPTATSTSKSATIRAWTTMVQVTTEKTGAVHTERRVVVQLMPHCVDGSSTLDCGGQYTYVAEYRVVNGRPAGCSATLDVGLQFSGGDDNPVVCRPSASGAVTITGTAAVGTTPTTSDAAAQRVTMKLTVDHAGRQRYEWRGRDGARCEGHVATSGPARRVECSWP